MRELAWKPRCVIIIDVNSSDKSTLDISSAPGVIRPRSPVPAAPICGMPELRDASNIVSPAFIKPPLLENVATASCANVPRQAVGEHTGDDSPCRQTGFPPAHRPCRPSWLRTSTCDAWPYWADHREIRSNLKRSAPLPGSEHNIGNHCSRVGPFNVPSALKTRSSRNPPMRIARGHPGPPSSTRCPRLCELEDDSMPYPSESIDFHGPRDD